MILPDKYLNFSNSLIGLGAEFLEHIRAPRTVSSLWNEMHDLRLINSFEHFTLCLDFLYCIGIVDFKDGLLRRIPK